VILFFLKGSKGPTFGPFHYFNKILQIVFVFKIVCKILCFSFVFGGGDAKAFLLLFEL